MMTQPAHPLQPPFSFGNGPRRQGYAAAGAKRVRSSAHAAPPCDGSGPLPTPFLLNVGGGAPWRAPQSVAPAGREAAIGQNKPDKPRATKTGQLDVLRTPNFEERLPGCRAGAGNKQRRRTAATVDGATRRRQRPRSASARPVAAPSPRARPSARPARARRSGGMP